MVFSVYFEGVNYVLLYNRNTIFNNERKEVVVFLISISKKEAELVRKKFPAVHIRRTVHKYYMEEAKRAMIYINKLRRGYEG